MRMTAPLVTPVLVVLPWSWFLVSDRLGVLTDVLAVVLPLLGALTVALAWLVARRWRRRRAYLVGSSAALAVAVGVLSPWLPADAGAVAPGGAVTVAGGNVADVGDSASDLTDLGADLLVVVEMTNELVEPLSAVYPHSYFEDGDPDFGVYSRLPFRVLEGPSPDLPGLRLAVEGPGGAFVLYALHVPRPWFTDAGPAYQVSAPEHARLVELVALRVAAEEAPVVVVGDLNTSDRSRQYRQLTGRAGLVDAMRGSWTVRPRWGSSLRCCSGSTTSW
ncbi:endonuclease/exonuclease/phosphatase family protein [Pseudonocardia nigra]|uniref:endonuclease/exonuclease/phosphatase family protein n=1 Tax=Pseudonocardia nigra TaxID=1921578 RepID=UPI001C5F8138|nr:endonuclease/exonuclease/phosphatase family protein [Pseudonocardia nigra]